MDAGFTRAELIAVAISRAVRDGDVVLTGTAAAIPTAGLRLAQARHAPRMVAINGAHGTVDPVADQVPLSSADPVLRRGRFNLSLLDVVTAECRRHLDIVFLGALQVDLSGRLNLALVGPPARPTLRGPGTLGLTAATVVRRSIVYLTRHDRRTLVEEVDFVSVEAMRGGGLELVVTPLAVFAPDRDRERLRLISIHPGVDPEAVAERTGFAVNLADAPETPVPLDDELSALRRIDSAGSLRDMQPVERQADGR